MTIALRVPVRRCSLNLGLPRAVRRCGLHPCSHGHYCCCDQAVSAGSASRGEGRTQRVYSWGCCVSQERGCVVIGYAMTIARREWMCLQFLCLLEPPFSLLARALPTLGSTSPVCAVWTARGLALWAGWSAIEAVRCEAGLKSSLCQMLRSDPIPGITFLETSLLFARKWKIIGLSCASDYLVTSPPNIRKDNIHQDEILAHTQKRMSMIP